MALTQNFGWDKPTVLGSLGAWGGMLNAIVDAIDSVLYSVQTTANAAMAKAGGAFTGVVTNKSDIYTVVDKGSMTGTVQLDLSAGNVFVGTISGATTLQFTNEPASAAFVVLELTNPGAYAITWPTGTRWPGGAAPQFTAAGTDIITLYRRGTGHPWRAALAQKDSR